MAGFHKILNIMMKITSKNKLNTFQFNIVEGNHSNVWFFNLREAFQWPYNVFINHISIVIYVS